MRSNRYVAKPPTKNERTKGRLQRYVFLFPFGMVKLQCILALMRTQALDILLYVNRASTTRCLPTYMDIFLRDKKKKAVHCSQGTVIPWESMHGHLVTNYNSL